MGVIVRAKGEKGQTPWLHFTVIVSEDEGIRRDGECSCTRVPVWLAAISFISTTRFNEANANVHKTSVMCSLNISQTALASLHLFLSDSNFGVFDSCVDV